MVKPRLVDPNIFKKLSDQNNVPSGLVNKITNNLSNNIVNFLIITKI